MITNLPQHVIHLYIARQLRNRDVAALSAVAKVGALPSAAREELSDIAEFVVRDVGLAVLPACALCSLAAHINGCPATPADERVCRTARE